MTFIEELETYPCSLTLRKLAKNTFVQDCIGLPEFLGLPRRSGGGVSGPDGQVHARVCHYSPTVWACSIGRSNLVYGYSAHQAVKSAIEAYDGTH